VFSNHTVAGTDTWVRLDNGGASPAYSCAWSTDGRLVAVGIVGSPHIKVFSFNVSTLTEMSDPVGSALSGTARAISFSDDKMVCATASSPYIESFSLSGIGS